MMIKRLILIISIFYICSICYAQEWIVDFKKEDVPVLNERLRSINKDTELLDSRVDDNAASIATLEAASDQGAVIQVVNTIDQAKGKHSGGVAIPEDDTAPTWAEGYALANLDTTITPTSATNELFITITLQWSCNSSADDDVVLALFQDPSGTDACISTQTAMIVTTNKMHQMTLDYYMTAGTTSATTFKLRFGNSVPDQFTINGIENNVSKYNSTLTSSMTIMEIEP